MSDKLKPTMAEQIALLNAQFELVVEDSIRAGLLALTEDDA